MPTTKEQGQTVAHRADWVWCPEQGLKSNAWVVLRDGLIQGVADRAPAGAAKLEHEPGLIMPGLVNAHTHLELSFLAGQVPPRGDFVDWVDRLVNRRPGHDQEQAGEIALAAAKASFDSGVALAGDITNTGRAVDAWLEAGVSAVSFGEALGPSRSEPKNESSAWHKGVLQANAVAAHAPYSIPAGRIKELKGRAANLPFCIHLAESRAEMEFFAGAGSEGKRLKDFLQGRGLDVDNFGFTADRPLQHLINLGVVDGGTLLVHGVQLNNAEAERIARLGAWLCVCPRSNLGLTGSMASVEEFLQTGAGLCLGTDSLASAPDLSLWAELKTLRKHTPGVPAEDLLRMATINGARALMQADHFGSLLPGRKASLVFAPLKESSARLVLDAAIDSGGAMLPC